MAAVTASTPTFFRFDNSYAKQLAGFYQSVSPDQVAEPRLLCFNRALAKELDAERISDLPEDQLAALFAGNTPFPGSAPLAQAYAGHQFGGFSPSLGDGRAHLLGEVIDRNGNRRDIALKGSGRTQFSRGGDGKAAVGPMLREYLLGEAMHGLGIPTTRGLAVVATGETVYREEPLPGAVLTRVAASHLRIGTFQYFAARGEPDRIRQLADYAIARHDPDLLEQPDRYLAWLAAVAERQAAMVARWMAVGFIHGVMNTDNMTLSGETIDYGPCAFMEAYDPSTVFSSIDQHGRYAYGNQPVAAHWNFARFVEAVLSLIDPEDTDRAVQLGTGILQQFERLYQSHWLNGMRAKLGLDQPRDDDAELINDWLNLLQTEAIDFTLGFRALSDLASGDRTGLEQLAGDSPVLEAWLARWQTRLQSSTLTSEQRARSMLSVNPLYIARNHLVEEALVAASEDNYLGPLKRLQQVLENPYEMQSGCEAFAAPAAAEFTERYRTFCGT